MLNRLYNLSQCDIFCIKENNNSFHVEVWTKDNDFIGSTQLKLTEGNVFVPDSIVARYSYGRSLHRLLIDIATDLGGSLAIVRDGDARGGALTVWSYFYADLSLIKTNIESYYNELDWTSIDDDPELFFSYKSSKERLVEKETINYFSDFNEHTSSLIKTSASIFNHSYEMDCNLWIDKEYPLKNPIALLEH